jgi:hypothetical protein
MKLRDVSISKGMTVNLGNYNTHRVEVGMTATFDDDDDYEKGIEQLTALVNHKLTTEIQAVTADAESSKRGKKVLMETIETDDQRLERTGSYVALDDVHHG